MNRRSFAKATMLGCALVGALLGGLACQSAEQDAALAPFPEEELVLGTDLPPAENIPVAVLEERARAQAAEVAPDGAAKTAGYQIYNPVGFYSQRDPNWKDDYVGFSTQKFYDVGCVVSSIAMAYNRWGYSLTPKQLNTWGKGVNPAAFTGVKVVFGRIGDYGRDRSVKWISSDEIYGYLQQGWPVIVETDAYGGHWVYLFAFSKNGDGRYWTKDPLKDHTAQDQPLTGTFRRACVFTW